MFHTKYDIYYCRSLYIDPGGEAGAAGYPEEEGGSGRGRGEEVGQFFKIFVCTLAR